MVLGEETVFELLHERRRWLKVVTIDGEHGTGSDIALVLDGTYFTDEEDVEHMRAFMELRLNEALSNSRNR